MVELWEDGFLPPRAVWLRQATGLEPAPVDLRLEGEGLVFSSLKPAEEGDRMVFRCYNATGSVVQGRLRTGCPLAAVERARADEREGEPLALDAGGTSVRFSAPPHAMVTLMLAYESRWHLPASSAPG